jgi:hypothetical protein
VGCSIAQRVQCSTEGTAELKEFGEAQYGAVYSLAVCNVPCTNDISANDLGPSTSSSLFTILFSAPHLRR